MAELTPEQKLRRMKELIRSFQRVAVAFSAGVDSTFVLQVALNVLGRENVLAVTGKSDSLARSEFAESVRLAALLGVEHVIVETDEFANPDYLANPTDRCYFCKVSLYERLASLVEERGFKTVLNGVNADDLGDWRPGIRAGQERGVRAPAAEAGLTKKDIRFFSKQMGLPTFDKPAGPCLSSRVPYGENITPEKLRMIESCESFLRGLGVPDCRVRHHGTLARIEVPVEYFTKLVERGARTAIDSHFRAAGYTYVALDLKGLRTGSMNEVIRHGFQQTSDTRQTP